MDVVDCDEVAGDCLFRRQEEVEAGQGVVSAGAAGAVGVDGRELVSTASAPQIQLSPGD